jgi:hypothetical protein
VTRHGAAAVLGGIVPPGMFRPFAKHFTAVLLTGSVQNHVFPGVGVEGRWLS